MSHATVFRRLGTIEKRLGVELFRRSRTGYSATAAGEDLADTAARIEADVLAAERRLAGRDLALSGSLRITTTDSLFMGLLAPLIARFREAHPEIHLEIALSDRLFNLTKRDADIALRPSNDPPKTLVGRHVGTIAQAVYGCANAFGGTVGTALEVQQNWGRSFPAADWIGPDAHLGYSSLDRWMAGAGLDQHCRIRVDSVFGMLAAARSGAGLSVLPCYLGDADEDLIRCSLPIPELETDLWLLTHLDLRWVARVRAFMDFVAEAVKARHGRLSPH